MHGPLTLVEPDRGERHGRKVRQRAEPLRKKLAHIHNIEVHVGATPPESTI